MREKIADIEITFDWRWDDSNYYLSEESIDQILKEICKEIEKVENPIASNKIITEADFNYKLGFEQCRQKAILKILEEK